MNHGTHKMETQVTRNRTWLWRIFKYDMRRSSPEAVIQATGDSGAVRHGAECFNYYFPQELDSEFLIVWSGLAPKPWKYENEAGLRAFLLERAEESNGPLDRHPQNRF